MSVHKHEFYNLDEMNKKIEFYLLDSISFEKKGSIKSRMKDFKTTSEFFNYYSNINIIPLFESFDNLDIIFSNINNHKNNFKSKVDKYISDFSNIFLLFALISKNQQIIMKAIADSQSNLQNFYLEYNINKDSQKKLDEFFDKLINIKSKTKNQNFSILTGDNIFNKTQKNQIINSKNNNIVIVNQKTEENNINFNCKLINIFPPNDNITKDTKKNDTSINNLLTPKFPYKKVEDNNNYNDQIDNNKDIVVNKNAVIKQESIQSFFTLASKKPSSNNNQEDTIPNTIDEKKEKIKDDFNMSSFLNNSELQFICSKSNKSEKMEDDEDFYYTTKNPKKQTFSCMNLKSRMEKSMLKDILGIINNLYKNGEINTEEKVKLKKLIITKSEKISRLYKSYTINDREFINELKKLII